MNIYTSKYKMLFEEIAGKMSKYLTNARIKYLLYAGCQGSMKWGQLDFST